MLNKQEVGWKVYFGGLEVLRWPGICWGWAVTRVWVCWRCFRWTGDVFGGLEVQ